MVFPSEDGFGCTKDVCAECWTVLNVGDRSNRSMKKEQTQRRQRGGLEMQPFGDSWIEQAMWQKYIEVTRGCKAGFKRRKVALVVSGGVPDMEGLEEGRCTITFPSERRWKGWWVASESLMCDSMPSRAWRKMVDHEMKTCHDGRGKSLVQMWNQVLQDAEARNVSTNKARREHGLPQACCGRNKGSEKPSLSCCGGCGQPCDWRTPNRLLSWQSGDTASKHVIFPACGAPDGACDNTISVLELVTSLKTCNKVHVEVKGCTGTSKERLAEALATFISVDNARA